MVMKIFVFLVVIIAIAVGVGPRLPQNDFIPHIVIIRDFFDATLPILAFGALIKYLCTCCIKCEICHEKTSEEKKPVS